MCKVIFAFENFVRSNSTIGQGKEVLTRFDVFYLNVGGVWGVDATVFCLAAQLRVRPRPHSLAPAHRHALQQPEHTV